MPEMRLLASLLAVLLLAACPSEEATPDTFEARATRVAFDPTSGAFWDLAFPSDLRLQEDGTWNLEDWPNADADELVDQWLRTADRRLVGGWGLSGGVVMPFTGPLDETSLPEDGADTTEPDSPVYLIDVDPESPQRGTRMPLRVRFTSTQTEFHPPDLLTAMPVWGFVRRPDTVYALVVAEGLLDRAGDPVGRSRAFHDAFEGIEGADPAAVASFLTLRETLRSEGVDPDAVVGATVFTTLDPARTIRDLAGWIETQPTPAQAEPWTVTEEYESFVLLEGRYTVPLIQSGERPYAEEGEGRFVVVAGQPVIQETQDVRLALTIPNGPVPSGGWPLLVYQHGSGGQYRQGVDRGPVDEENPGVPEAGTGPAEWLARRGVATVGFDYPLHGDRNDPPDTTGLLLYNLLGNIDATIDNFRWAALEPMLLTRFMLDTSVDPTLHTELEGDALITFDPDRLTTMGQSMGSTLGVTQATVDPRVKGAVFSGSGGVLVEIAETAVEPFEIRPILAGRLGIAPDELTQAHPLLHAFQHLWDLVDPVAQARHVVVERHPGVPGKHIFMTAGVRDGYFHPRSEAALATALGATLVGEEVEPILPDTLRLAGRDTADYPLARTEGNFTVGVVQYAAPNTQGHYVAFNQEGARYQYTCFVQGIADGGAIPAPDALDAPCP
jgi:hypothetical protein